MPTDSTVNDQLREYLQRIALPTKRPTFDIPPPAGEGPQSVRLAEGPARTGIIGIPSTVALCGPHQYLEFAKHFRELRNFFALQVPGFVAGERLPASVEVAVEVEAEAVRRCMDGAPTVLVGYSSGGTLAYGIAGHLEALATPVAGVVLIDAYPFRTVNSDASQTQALLRKMFDDRELRRYLTGTRLTAMAWYAQLFRDWQLTTIAAPTLLVQPTEPMPGMSHEGAWNSVWPHPHETVRVPGDHWTMMMEHATATATAVETWISERLGWCG